MAASALELVEDLQVRSVWGNREATAVVHTMERLLDSTTSQLVTRDQLDARMAEQRSDFERLRADFAELRAEIKSDKAELHAVIRSQTVWFTGVIATGIGVLIAAAGVGLAVARLLI